MTLLVNTAKAAAAQTRGYLAHLGDPRSEVAIRLAMAALILALADPVLTELLEVLAPHAHQAWTSLDDELRRWLAGGPLAFVWLTGCVVADWRSLRP